MIDTKDKILDAAERAFSENGYTGVSLRSIIGEAGVNLAAVHYHFGSKEGLLKAVILRRVGPVNAERLAMLDACERAAGGGRLEVEKVLEAFLVPTFRMARKSGGIASCGLPGGCMSRTCCRGWWRRNSARWSRDLKARCGGRCQNCRLRSCGRGFTFPSAPWRRRCVGHRTCRR